MTFCSKLQLKEVQTTVSKHLAILPNIRRSGSNARVWAKAASSATFIVCLVYNVMWCGISVKCDGLWCGMACIVMVQWWDNILIQFYQMVVFYSPRQAYNALKKQIKEMQDRVKRSTLLL